MTLPPFSLRDWRDEDVSNPYPVYQRYREAASVHEVEGTFYVFGHDEVAKVLASQVYGRSARVAGSTGGPMVPSTHSVLRTMVENWLVFLDPPRHTELRSVLNKEFSPGVVTNLRSRITSIAADLLTAFPPSGPIDLVESFTAPFPILVISELLGVPRDHWDWLRQQAVDLQEASSSRAASNPNAHKIADTAARELHAYFLDLASRRRTSPGVDLVSLLVSAQTRGEPLSDDEIVSTCVHLMTAGHETTTNVLSKAVLTLADRPDSLASLRSGISTSAVEELTRFDSPVQSVTRWAYHDSALAGTVIPRGSKLVVMLGAANRDPARFTDPDTLDLNRPAGRNVSFGLGIHYCLGATLARAEIEIGLNLLLTTLGEFTVDSVKFPHDLVFHGPSHVLLNR